MLFLQLLIVAYLIVGVIATLMVFSAIPNPGVRFMFVILGLVMPIIFLYATVTSLFATKRMLRFNEDMAKVEDEIEAERLRIFGGEPTCPSFGERWQLMYQAYIEKIVDKAAATSEKIVSIGTGISLGRAA